MNIFDSTPRKVKCVANYDTPIYSIHKDELEIGKLYTVKKVEVDSWCTAVYLEEFPYERGYAFNSVYFEELEGEEKEVPRIAIPLDVSLDEAIKNEEFKVIRFADVPEPKIENRWISVTERLPEEHTRVLVCDRTSVYMANLNDGWWYFSPAEIGMIVKQSDISAWMPLPEPWKGDEE